MRSRPPLATLRDGLTRIGERFGIQWLIYNPLVFLYYHQHAVASAPTVADTLEAVFPEARRFLDVGAGSGGFAAELQRRGHEVVALEHARLGRLIGRRQGVAMERFDLGRPDTLRRRTADVAYCFEVAEHLPPELGDTLVRFIAESAPTVVFTAAPPGQGGTGHINEQPETYWISRFERAGMEHRPDVGARVAQGFAAARSSWLAKNVHVFARPAGRPR